MQHFTEDKRWFSITYNQAEAYLLNDKTIAIGIER